MPPTTINLVTHHTALSMEVITHTVEASTSMAPESTTIATMATDCTDLRTQLARMTGEPTDHPGAILTQSASVC